jgi:hypothetical protein
VRRWPEAARTAAHGAASNSDGEIRVGRGDTSTNRYDRRDPCFSVASDEPTAGKSERRSNSWNSSAPR